MAKVETALQFIEAGSNSMGTYQAFMSAANSDKDYLSIIQNGTNVVATVSNVAPMLKPVRIVTNSFSATSVLVKIVTDWKDPTKKVQPGDVLSLISSTGTIVFTLLVWKEIGPGAGAAVSALVLSSDLQSAFQPYVGAAKVWLGSYISSMLQISTPASLASSSLYWSTLTPGMGYDLATYDEILTQEGLFICLGDKGVSGSSLIPLATPVPGSFTSIDEDSYKEKYCRYLSVKEGWGDIVSGMDYCKNVRYR